MASLIHPGFAQQLVSAGFTGYQGWGDDEAYADFQATKGAGKYPQGSGMQPISMTFTVPEALAGKTIKQLQNPNAIPQSIRSASGSIFANTGFGLPDWMYTNPSSEANRLGVDPNVPLKKGQTIEFKTDDPTYQGGAYYLNLAALFGQPSSLSQNAEGTIQNSIAKLNAEVSSKFKQYTTANPFKVDDILKQKKLEAHEQIDPYYNETLSNYLLGVEKKIARGSQDTRDLLTELGAQTSQYTQNAQFKLNEAVNRAREGFADAGLFESGQRYRAEGLLGRESGVQTEDFLRGQAFRENIAKTGYERTLQDIGLGSLTGQNLRNIKNINLANITGLGLEPQQEIRNVERQRFTETEQRANELLRESGQKYVAGFQATLPPESQQNTSFDLLKQIGIYT